MSDASVQGFPVSALDRIWHPPAGGRRLLDPKAAIRLPAARHAVAAARAQLKRIIEQAPQVMVKVSGRQKGGDHVSAHFEYIGRRGELEVESDDGETLTLVTDLRGRAQEWQDDDPSDRANAVTSISMVLSMPAGTDAGKVLAAARAFARVEFEGRHRYMLALHDDTDHPHVHLTVAAAPVEADGARFNPRKADLHRMRETFAHELRERGIEADATPRRARGVVRRADNVALRKLKERFAETGGLIEAEERTRRAGLLFAKGEAELAPWERAAVARQQQVKSAYQRVASVLETLPDSEDRMLGTALRRFVEAMPAPLSRRMTHAIEHLERLKRDEGADAVARMGVFRKGPRQEREKVPKKSGDRPPPTQKPPRDRAR